MSKVINYIIVAMLIVISLPIFSQDFPEIITPNGSETLYVGANYEIEWTGISSADTVTIEYSLDRCSNWIMITEKATGLKYTWKNIPNTISNNCLLRIRKYKKFETIGVTKIMHEHKKNVYRESWSPDGTKGVTVSLDGSAIVWDLVNNKMLYKIQAHDETYSAAWSKDGVYFATGGIDTIKIWYASTGKLFKSFEAHKGEIPTIAWKPDECLVLASGAADGSVKVWDLKYNSLISIFKNHSNFVHGIAWSNKGDKLASASWDKSVNIYNMKNGQLIKNMPNFPSYTYHVFWSPNDSLLSLSTGIGDLGIRIYNTSDWNLARNLIGHTDKINTVIWNKNGRNLLSASDDSSIKLWDVFTGAILNTYNEKSSVYYADYSPQGNRILSAEINGTVTIRGKDTIDYTEDISDTLWSIVPNPANCFKISFDYKSFDTNTNVLLREDSKLKDSSISLLKLQPFAQGAVLNKSKVFFKNGFTTSFSFSSANGNNNQNYDASLPGADGVTLVLQNNPSAVLGGRGGEIGYNGTPNAIALEIDTYRNGLDYNDVNGNHIALQTTKDGKLSSHHDNSLAINNDIFILKDNISYYVKMDYDATKKHIDVYLDTNSNLLNKVLSVDNVNLDQIFGSNNGNCWIGITSASGVAFAEYFIHNWSYCEKDGSFISDVETEQNNSMPNQNEIYSEILVYNQIGQFIQSGENVSINQLKATLKANEPLFFYCKNSKGSQNYKLIIE